MWSLSGTLLLRRRLQLLVVVGLVAMSTSPNQLFSSDVRVDAFTSPLYLYTTKHLTLTSSTLQNHNVNCKPSHHAVRLYFAKDDSSSIAKNRSNINDQNNENENQAGRSIRSSPESLWIPSTPIPPIKTKPKEQQRDLFIPIFVMISIVGFVGLYAYETIRLYLAGEFYPPFSQ